MFNDARAVVESTANYWIRIHDSANGHAPPNSLHKWVRTVKIVLSLAYHLRLS
jgi:hypothetical protein